MSLRRRVKQITKRLFFLSLSQISLRNSELIRVRDSRVSGDVFAEFKI